MAQKAMYECKEMMLDVTVLSKHYSAENTDGLNNIMSAFKNKIFGPASPVPWWYSAEN